MKRKLKIPAETMEEAVAILKNQLAALEGGLKKHIDELNASADGASAAARPWTRAEVKVNIKVIDGLFERTCATLLKLEGHHGPQQYRRNIITKNYVSAKSLLDAMLQETEPVEHQSVPLMEQIFQQQPNRADHLPRLDLPRYNGNPTEFMIFKGRFEKRIATIVSDSDKFGFLSRALELFEPGRNSVEAMENSGSSFAEAWAKLEARFYKKRVAYEGYFTKLLKFKKLTTATGKGIMSLIDAVDTTVHAAKQIKGETSATLDCVANGILVSFTKCRLDPETAGKIEEKMDIHRVYTWAEFKEELERRANQLACQEDFDERKPRNAKQVAAAATTQVQKPPSEGKQVKNGSANQEKMQPCPVCGGRSHPIWQCAAFKELTPPQKWDRVRRAGRCFNCLSWGHPISKCQSQNRCRECGEPHHTLLHPEDVSPEKERPPPVVQASTSGPQ